MTVFSEGPPNGQWVGIEAEQAQQWQQLKRRHYLAIIDLRRQQVDWAQQVLELKAQLVEIQQLYQSQQLIRKLTTDSLRLDSSVAASTIHKDY